MALLLPKKSKYRRTFKGRLNGSATRGATMNFGEFGLKATSSNLITSRQIESARRAIVGYLKRGGKVWIRIFPDKPITRKPNEVRMGSGKGALDHFVAPVQRGRVLFELAGVSREQAKRAFELAATKLPVSTKFLVTGEEND